MKLLVLALLVGIVAAHHHEHDEDSDYDKMEIPAYGVSEENRPPHPKKFPREHFSKLFDNHALIFYPDHEHPERLTGYYMDKGFSRLHQYRAFERLYHALKSRKDLVAYVFYPGGFHSPRFFETYIRGCTFREDLRTGELLKELSDSSTTPVVVFWPRTYFENAHIKLERRLGWFRMRDGVFHTFNDEHH